MARAPFGIGAGEPPLDRAPGSKSRSWFWRGGSGGSPASTVSVSR